jgi:cyanate lyase
VLSFSLLYLFRSNYCTTHIYSYHLLGMGEPLDNYNNVTEACRTMIDTSRWNLAHGRVTVSTVGLISQIRRLTKELPEVSLALSLHAPNQDARTAIVPTASRYPIEGLIDALDNHMMAYLNQRRKRRNSSNNNNSITAAAVEGTAEQQLQVYTVEERIKESSRRRAMIEYIMLTGETSSFECAHQLGKLCENRHLVVNLIPYNATDVKDKLQCPTDEHMLEFREIVQSYGTFCTIRRTMGADIASACGQLVQKKEQEEEEQQQGKIMQKQQQDATVDIEDVVMKRDNTSTNNETLLAKGSPETSNITITKSQSIPVGIPSGQKNIEPSTWTESLSSDDLDRWSRILTVTATISATCFVASSIVFFQRKRP